MNAGFLIDTNQCVGCRSCEMACKTEYGIQAGQGRRRRVIEKTTTEGSDVRTFFISLACNHCLNPACIAACPNSLPANNGTNTTFGTKNDSALWKDDSAGTDSSGLGGVVHYNSSRCIGCRRCEWACPYGQPQFDPDQGYIHKCELCYQRIDAWRAEHSLADTVDPNAIAGLTQTQIADKRRQPACVATCIGRAIHMDRDVATDATAVTMDGGGSSTHVDFDDQYDLDNLADGEPKQTAGRIFEAAGVSGVGLYDRGSQYLADNILTNPAVRICNKVYKGRDGVSS